MNRRKTLDISAKTTSGGCSSLFESRSSSKIDYLVRIGLGSDRTKPSLYRRVLQDPHQGVSNQSLRPYTAEVMDNLLDLVFDDSIIWNRVKTILLRKHPGRLSSLKEEISDEGLRALLAKSNDHEIPLDTIFEVYSRGAAEGNERDGFSRVNSFIAGGKARKLDADLLGETVVKEKTQDRTLSIVKRVLAEKKEKN